ncbi:GNAT family N-acetyltransferase [Flavobacterium phycosphaerae]|uniref:GNAT family N-acetyltransferase n=1 Tax=Flavobacterium phycosphaerae TaxID=2697515 RepID=UPI00138ADF29|nr:GNAT family N-acetyltransferase [Flavobacterium phycosphaerae]
MIFREAQPTDIKPIQLVRNAVTENALSNPDLVTDADCMEFMFERGKGWVCEMNHQIVGFAIADLKEHNIWALFVHPNHDKKGIGKVLHNLMLTWYFLQTKETVWLGTAPGTRAEEFYKRMGWQPAGWHGTKEVKFEMSYRQWQQIQATKTL